MLSVPLLVTHIAQNLGLLSDASIAYINVEWAHGWLFLPWPYAEKEKEWIVHHDMFRVYKQDSIT
jgi:hypothetical protein